MRGDGLRGRCALGCPTAEKQTAHLRIIEKFGPRPRPHQPPRRKHATDIGEAKTFAGILLNENESFAAYIAQFPQSLEHHVDGAGLKPNRRFVDQNPLSASTPYALRLTVRPQIIVLQSQIVTIERIAEFQVPIFITAAEPTDTLSRRAVRERIRHHITLRPLLDMVVANGARRTDRFINVAPFDEPLVRLHLVGPNSCKAIGL